MTDPGTRKTSAAGASTTPGPRVPASGAPPAPRRGPRNDPFPEIRVTWIDVEDIEESPRRVRRAVEGQKVAVKRSMERFGNRIPILVTGRIARGGHEVIDGHARLAAARLLGAAKIPCIVVDDLPDTEVRRLALSLNKLQETGTWDADALRLEIKEIIEIDGDIEIPGFAIPEIEAMCFGADDAAAADPADDVSRLAGAAQPAVTRPGDTWILGEHRVRCGSARDPEAIAGLMAGDAVDAVFTDPPYNVQIKGHVRSADTGFDEFAEASGEMSPAEFTTFLDETLGGAAELVRPGGVLFVCMDWRHVAELSAALDARGLTLLNICVWIKSAPGMGSLYRSQHELVFVARKPGAGHRNNVQLGQFGRNRSNVWRYPGATGGRSDGDDDFAAHPTVKPIRMVMDALLDVTAPGARVLDPFLGSGTTLLAAERTRRRAVGLEIEPAYVDLAVRRWQDMTGGQAVHAATGARFDDLASAGIRGDAAENAGTGPSTARRAASSAPSAEDF